MSAREALRTLQEPLKDRYREDPSSAVITLTAAGSLDGDGIACSVTTAASGSSL